MKTSAVSILNQGLKITSLVQVSHLLPSELKGNMPHSEATLKEWERRKRNTREERKRGSKKKIENSGHSPNIFEVPQKQANVSSLDRCCEKSEVSYKEFLLLRN